MERGDFGNRLNNNYLLDELKEELLYGLEERPGRQRARNRRLSRRELGRLRGEIYNELQALRAIENRVKRSRVSPEARSLLFELMDEASVRGITMDDLYQTFQERPSLTGRISGFLQSRNGAFLLILLLAILATPAAREALKPGLKKLAGEISELAGQARVLLAKIKEGIEDIVAEAQFEKIKDAMDQAINEDVPADPGPETK